MNLQTARLFRTVTQDNKSLGQLVKPSLLSSSIAGLVSLALCSGTLLLLSYNGSTWQYFQRTQAPPTVDTASMGYQIVGTGSRLDTLLSNASLLLFWGVVGLLTYFFTAAVVRAYQHASEIHEEMDFVNSNPKELVHIAVERLILRVAAFAAWVLFIQYSLHVLIPYGIALIYASVSSTRLTGALYVITAIAMSFIVLHIHTVLFRLLVGRTRVFGA